MAKPKTPKLSDTQLVILSSASRRDDALAVLPDKVKGGAAKAAVAKLITLRFLKEVRVKRDQPAWRTDEEGKPVGLKITKAGSAAIGIEDEGTREEEPAPPPKRGGGRKAKGEEPNAERAEKSPRAGSKKALVLSLLSRPEGATIDDLLSATGWLPHTTRAALTGLRKEGYEFLKSKNAEGETVYRTEKAGKAAGKPE